MKANSCNREDQKPQAIHWQGQMDGQISTQSELKGFSLQKMHMHPIPRSDCFFQANATVTNANDFDSTDDDDNEYNLAPATVVSHASLTRKFQEEYVVAAAYRNGGLRGKRRSTRSLLSDDSDDDDDDQDGIPSLTRAPLAGQTRNGGMLGKRRPTRNLLEGDNDIERFIQGRKTPSTTSIQKIPFDVIEHGRMEDPHPELRTVLEVFPEANKYRVLSLLRQESLTTTLLILGEESMALPSDDIVFPPELEYVTTFAQAEDKGREIIMSYAMEMFPKIPRAELEKVLMDHSTHTAISILAKRNEGTNELNSTQLTVACAAYPTKPRHTKLTSQNSFPSTSRDIEQHQTNSVPTGREELTQASKSSSLYKDCTGSLKKPSHAKCASSLSLSLNSRDTMPRQVISVSRKRDKDSFALKPSPLPSNCTGFPNTPSDSECGSFHALPSSAWDTMPHEAVSILGNREEDSFVFKSTPMRNGCKESSKTPPHAKWASSHSSSVSSGDAKPHQAVAVVRKSTNDTASCKASRIPNGCGGTPRILLHTEYTSSQPSSLSAQDIHQSQTVSNGMKRETEETIAIKSNSVSHGCDTGKHVSKSFYAEDAKSASLAVCCRDIKRSLKSKKQSRSPVDEDEDDWRPQYHVSTIGF